MVFTDVEPERTNLATRPTATAATRIATTATSGFFDRLGRAEAGGVAVDGTAGAEHAPVRGIGLPQPEQNFAPSGFWVPHLGQNIEDLPS